MSETRSKQFILAAPEARTLEWIASRLPGAVMPDHLTALGVVAAVGIAVAYVLSNESPLWLWAASALLVVHWLGDSLDGTLARVRGTQRPKYGYYLDHLVDAIATAVIGIGLGLSPHMLLATGLVIVVVYLVLSINTYLETYAFGVFSLGYGRVGPTEARLALIALNTVMALGVGLRAPGRAWDRPGRRDDRRAGRARGPQPEAALGARAGLGRPLRNHSPLGPPVARREPLRQSAPSEQRRAPDEVAR